MTRCDQCGGRMSVAVADQGVCDNERAPQADKGADPGSVSCAAPEGAQICREPKP